MVAPLHARVAGAGPTGSLAALALAAAGWRVDLHDPQPRERLLARSRAYAFTHSSRRLLQRLDLWRVLEPDLVPFDRLHLRDRWLERGVDFGPLDLAAGSRPAGAESTARGAVGWIGRHGPLLERLLERLEAHPAVGLHLGGTPVPAGPVDLEVAADGPASPTRERLGIGQWGWDYAQACLTVQVELRGARQHQAWELLRPEGPFALLPLGGRSFQVVWSAPRGRCQRLESQPDAAFLDSLAGVLPERMQPDALLDSPRVFPVALRLARRLHRGRVVLVGESAHCCHPVGGQGLNLCWRDVAVLHRLAQAAARGRLAPRRIPAAYGRRRWIDLLFTLAVTDLLVRVYSCRRPLLGPPRRLAVSVLARSRGLRRLLLTAMTEGPCSAVAPGAQ
ncbi:MAG: FAD-dependent monooxygenase [Synechococcaceae cyanobacterium]|nr:FAD-dependent monooxygenase [Synechococcaceae cyanobacterium]